MKSSLTLASLVLLSSACDEKSDTPSPPESSAESGPASPKPEGVEAEGEQAQGVNGIRLRVTGPGLEQEVVYQVPPDPLMVNIFGDDVTVMGARLGSNPVDPESGPNYPLSGFVFELEASGPGKYTAEALDIQMSMRRPGDAITVGEKPEGTVTVEKLSKDPEIVRAQLDLVLGDKGTSSEGDRYQVQGTIDLEE